MKIIKDKYLGDYRSQLQVNLEDAVTKVKETALTAESFTFYTSVAVISSSRIEGEQMEVDSYVKHKVQGIEYLPGLVEKPNDLYKAYLFAKDNQLTKENFLKSHALLSEHLLPKTGRGVYRKNEMVVMEHHTGRIQFEAAPFSIVEAEMEKLWDDIRSLQKKKLTNEEIFYYASFIHLLFVCIHPFNDGNGRAGRLLAKWFLSSFLGDTAWYIQSEKYYYYHVNEYYKNLNRLGVYYEKLDYSKAGSFLMMLPGAVNYTGKE
jgi:Fic family protein